MFHVAPSKLPSRRFAEAAAWFRSASGERRPGIIRRTMRWMNKIVRETAGERGPQDGHVEVVSRAQVTQYPRWATAFSAERKDHRYYELVEDTIRQGFEYRFFLIKNGRGEIRAIQPFLILDQDILAGASAGLRAPVDFVRRLWPRFMRMRTLMVGCAAGEGHIDGDPSSIGAHARTLAAAIARQARALNTKLIVLKEFPAKYRTSLQCFLRRGFTRVPSLPMTRLNIDYASFDDYMRTALSSKMRNDLRRKFAAAAQAPPIEMTVVDDITPIIDEVYPLYLSVYERSDLHFEKLTKEYFCRLGRLMPDKVRYFVWRQDGKIIAFSLCMVQGDAIYAEYLGLDYSIALDLHLYHYAFRDVVTWAMAHGYKWFCSGGLNYDPKLHLRSELDPLDLYVRHTSRFLNLVLKGLLPFLEPTRYDRALPRFPNYNELWGR
jgi:peptidoglycan biosynthesis/recognition FemAB-like protein